MPSWRGDTLTLGIAIDNDYITYTPAAAAFILPGAPIPEPAAATGLLALGLAGLRALRRAERRRTARA